MISRGGDIELIVGAERSLSYEQLVKDISAVCDRINQNPPKIKVQFDLSDEANSLRQNIQQLYNAVSKIGVSTPNGGTFSGLNRALEEVRANTASVVIESDRLRASLEGARNVAVELPASQLQRIYEGLSFQGVDDDLATKIAFDIDELNAKISAVKVNWRDFGEDSKQVADVTITANDGMGRSFTSTIQYIQQMNAEGEREWNIRNRGSATINLEAEAIERENQARRDEKEYVAAVTKSIKEYYDLQVKAAQISNGQDVVFDHGKNKWVSNSGDNSRLAFQLNQAKAAVEGLTAAEKQRGISSKSLQKIDDAEVAGLKRLTIAREGAANKAKAAAEKAATSKENQAKRESEATNELIKQADELRLKYIDAAYDKKNKPFRSQLIAGVNELNELKEKLRSGKISADEFNTELERMNTTLANTGVRSKSFKDLVSTFQRWFGTTRIAMALYNAIKKLINASIELDSCFTRLQIVTGATDSDMSHFADTTIDLSQRLGKSVTEVAGTIETFSRLGYSLSEAEHLTEFATIISNVAGVDLSDATTGITSIIKGFSELDVSSIEHVADVLIEVGQKFAVSADEMLRAFERSGAALSATGTSFEKSVALIAAANASVQNAEVVGTALKTLSARVRSSKAELEELGESADDLVDGFAKYAEEIKSISGVDIMVEGTTNQFKDLYDIFNEIAQVWDRLSDTQRSRISEILGGTRQLQVISSILGNWSDAVNAYSTAMHSAGVATQANDKYMGTAAAHIQQFNAAFQALGKQLVSSKLVSSVVSLGTGFLKLVTALSKARVLLPVIVGSLTTYATVSRIVSATNLAKHIMATYNAGTKQIVATAGMTTAISNLTMAEKRALAIELTRKMMAEGMTADEIKQQLATLGLTGSTYTLSAANNTLAGSFKAVAASIPIWGWISLAITLVIEAVTLLTNKTKTLEEVEEDHRERLKQLREEYDQIRDSVSQAASDFRELRSSADEIIPRFVELASRVNEFGEKAGLTDEEYSEFRDLCDQIAQILPDLVYRYDENGNAILRLSYKSDTLAESLWNAVDASRELANVNIAYSLDDAFNNALDRSSEINRKITDYTNRITEAKGILPHITTAQNWYEYYFGPDDSEFMAVDLDVPKIDVNLLRDMGLDDFPIDIDSARINPVLAADTEGGWDALYDRTSKAVTNYVAMSTRIIHDAEDELRDVWDGFGQIVDAWVSTDPHISRLPDEMQNTLLTIVSGLDFGKIVRENDIGSSDEMKTFLNANLIQPILDADPEIKQAFNRIPIWRRQLEDGLMTSEEFRSNVTGVFQGFFESIDPQKIDLISSAFVSGFNEIGITGNSVGAVISSIIDQWIPSLDEATTETTGTLTDLSKCITNLRSNYELLDTAAQESAGTGLTANTINSIREAVDGINELTGGHANYLDFLYEENGVIKLNTEAFREFIETEANGNLRIFRATDERLRRENDELRTRIQNNSVRLNEIDQMLNTGYDGYDMGYFDALVEERDELSNAIDQDTDALNRNTQAIQDNQNKLSLYQTLYGSSLDPYTSTVANYTNTITSLMGNVSSTLKTVADLQAEVANGFTMSLDRALEFAAVYPEILEGATLAADGQITLNEAAVNAFIEGKHAEQQAAIDAEISNLEARRSGYEAAIRLLQLQLDAARDGDIERLNFSNALVRALIDNGIEEATAYELGCEAMAGNTDELSKHIMQACIDSDGNINTAAYNAAKGVTQNSTVMRKSLVGVAKGAHNAARAVSGIPNGQVIGYETDTGTGGDTWEYQAYLNGLGNYSTSGGNFNGTSFDYTVTQANLEDYIRDLNIDIENYLHAIDLIDGQIAILRALRERGLASFGSNSGSSGSNTGNSGHSGSSSSGSSSGTNWFTTEYKLHQHLRNMDMENTEDYIAWLNTAYQQAYEEGLISLDDFMRYQEEVFRGVRDLFKDYLNDVEHEISMLGHFEGNESEIIALYQEMLDAIEQEIETARAQGLDDTDDYIQELQNKWWSYHDAIENIQNSISDNAKDALDKLVQIRINMIKDEINREKQALKERLDNLRSFYQEQKDLLSKQREEEKYEAEQAKKRKRIADIQTELAQLQYDDSAWAQRRRAELMQELADAQAELDEYERDHAVQAAQEYLDRLSEQQEEAINDRLDELDKEEQDAIGLYQRALNDIRNGSVELYNEMIEWNSLYGDGITETITDAWENAYRALQAYADLYGDFFEGINLGNYTGYTPGDSWDEHPINGSDNGDGSSGGNSTEPEPPPPPSLSTGDTITVKDTATNYSPKSGGKHIPDFVRGGRFTVYRLDGDEVLIGRDGVYTGWIYKHDIVGYAKGTRHAAPGIHSVNELGAETIFTSSDGSHYRLFSGGEKVLNARASDFLYNFATGGEKMLDGVIKRIFGGSIPGVRPIINNNEFVLGDIVIEGNADQHTVSAIRRAQRDSVNMILKEFDKLNN